MIVDDSFSRLTTRTIVHDSFSVSCFGNHWPDSGQKTCSRSFSSRKIHTFTSLSYGTHFSIYIFRRKELGTRFSRDIREFKITTTATATGKSLNKRFNEQNNGSARAL